MKIVRLERAGHDYELVHHGGRLADIAIDGLVVAATEVGDYDWTTSSQRRELDHADLAAALEAWIDDDGPDHLAELRYRR
jgi:hypothetical protein